MTGADSVPYQLTRVGMIMSPEPGNPLESEGVLNPASGRTPDGRVHLLPRLVAAGNVSRVGLAELVLSDGVPVGVNRRGVVLEPDQAWERGVGNAGVEDPRVTWIAELGTHVMTYVAFGPLGPRLALAVSQDLRHWRRLGPVQFGYEPELGTDFSLYPNKDAVWFGEPVPGPDGRPAFALLHRPMWDLGWIRPGQGEVLPAGVSDPRPGIWISYVDADAARTDIRALARPLGHRCVAMPQYAFEELKIGAGPPPLRVEQGWLVLHHGVSGTPSTGFDPTTGAVLYSAGALLLDAADPAWLLARTAEPLLRPDTEDEQVGVVGNVVFPTAIETIGEQRFVFYGMADARIGVARLDHIAPPEGEPS